MTREQVKAGLVNKTNGGTDRPPISRIADASVHLKAARLSLLTWIREHYVHSNNITENLDTVKEFLELAEKLENIRARLDVKASLHG